VVGDPTAWTVEWHTTASGQRPMRAFLEGLAGRNREEAIALIELVGRWGNQLRPPRSKPLGGRLFESRGHDVRIFYTFRPGRRIVLLDGLVKKRDQIPHDVLALVRRYQSEAEATSAR